MPWFVGTAPKAVRELGLGSMSSLAQNGAALQVIFSWLHVGWSLSGEDTWNMLGARRKEGSCRRRWGAGDKEVLLEASTDGARCEAAFHRCGRSYPAAVHVGSRHVPPMYRFRATVAKSTDKSSGSRFEICEKREPLDGDSAQALWFTR